VRIYSILFLLFFISTRLFYDNDGQRNYLGYNSLSLSLPISIPRSLSLSLSLNRILYIELSKLQELRNVVPKAAEEAVDKMSKTASTEVSHTFPEAASVSVPTAELTTAQKINIEIQEEIDRLFIILPSLSKNIDSLKTYLSSKANAPESELEKIVNSVGEENFRSNTLKAAPSHQIAKQLRKSPY